MITGSTRVVGATLAAAAILASLVSCASEQALEPVSPPPTMAPEQSVAEACEASRAEVDAIVHDAKQRVEDAGTAVVSGELPDLSGIVPSLTTALDRVSGSVTHPDVSAAINSLQAEIDGFGSISAPDDLAGLPAYLSALGAQAADLQAAGARFQELCETR